MSTALSRRGFLKTTVAAAGVLAGSGTLTALAASDKAPEADQQIFSAACRGNCMGGCPLEVTVRNGKVVKTEAWPVDEAHQAYRRICQRGRSHVNLVYNPERIQHPLRRKEGTERGAGEWEVISWEDAIKEITDKWKGYIAQYGPSSVGFSFASGNYGSAFGVNTANMGYYAKLLNVMNATYVHHCYDELSGKYAQAMNMGLTASPAFLLESKAIVCWGVNPTESIIHTWHFVTESKQNGAKLVVIDPNYTIAASKADLWVRLRPGSDPALALALSNKFVNDGLANEMLLKTYTTMPCLVRDDNGYLLKLSDLGELPEGATDESVVAMVDGSFLGASVAQYTPHLSLLGGVKEVNGIPVHTVWELTVERNKDWTFEKASQVCDLPVSIIEELYEVFKNCAPTSIIIGLGLDHYENGFHSYSTIALLSAVSGNLVTRGGGIDMWDMCTINWYCNVAPCMPTGPSTSDKVLIIGLNQILDTKKYNGKDLNLKSIIFCTHNYIGNGADRNRSIEALNKLELIVTTDIVMTDTCRYSDIVLPICHWFEQEDFFSFYSPFLTMCEKCIEPQFESKDNYDVVQMLAKGMGLDAFFGETREEYMRATMDSAMYNAFGLTYDRLKQEKVIGLLTPDGAILGLYYATSAARANFYFGDPTEAGNHTNDFEWGDPFSWKEEAVAHFAPPYEAWTETVGEYKQSEASKKYPLVYASYRNKMKCHSQFGYNEWLLEIFPEPYMMTNKEDMEARGVKDGDVVRVFNDRGEVVIKAIANNGIHKGMVVIPKGWQSNQFIAGHYANLTGLHCKANAENSYFFDATCEYELYKGGNN